MGGSNQAPVILPPPPPPELIVAIPNSGNPDNTDKIIFYSDFNCTGGQQKIFYEINLTPSNTLQLIGFLPKSFEVGYNLNFSYRVEYQGVRAFGGKADKISPDLKFNINPLLFSGTANFTISTALIVQPPDIDFGKIFVVIPNSGNSNNTNNIIFYSDFNCTGQQKIFDNIILTPSNTLQLIGFLPKSVEVGYNLNFYYKLEYPRQNIANSQDINKISPEKSVKYNIDPILFNGIINFTIRAIILPTKVGSVEKNDYISMTFPDGTTKLIYEQPTVFNNGITEVFVKGTITKGNFPTKMSFRSIGFLMITSDEVPKLENGAVGGAMTVNPMYNAYTKTFSNLPGISKDIIETSEFYNIWNSHNWKYWILPIIKLPQPVPQQAPLIVQSNGNIGIPKSVQNFEGFSDIGDNAFFYLIIIAIILIVYFNYNRIRKLF